SNAPFEDPDRINLNGNKIAFDGKTANLTNATKTILDEIAQLIVSKKLTIRVEVHVALGTNSKSKAAIKKQAAKDKDLTQRRVDAINNYLATKGVAIQQLLGGGALGSDRPLGSNAKTDPANERVDFIKAAQGNP